MRLIAGECDDAAKWALTESGELQYTEGAASPPRCAAVHATAAGPHPPPGPPAPVQAPEIWAKPQPGKGAAIALLNRGAAAAPMAVALKDIPWLG